MANKAENGIIRKSLGWLTAFMGLWLILNIQAGWCGVESRENQVVLAVRHASPAVVNISSEYEIHKNSNPFTHYGMDPRLEKFFNDFFAPEMERREKRTSLGSGVIIDGSRGFVLTNTHVVEKATTISIALNDQREFEASIVGMDPDSDLAVLRIVTEQTLPAIRMGDSDDLMIGESVIAIGNPFGFSHTVTTGVISAVDRSVKTADRVFHEFIQTDASINPGNSGGPLINIDGELIGINTAIYAQAQGIGFAIPINRARRIISDLINYGEVIQPWVGLTIQPLDADLAAYLNMNSHEGVLVKTVEARSPAEQAGIEEGDVILSIDGKKISGIDDYHLKLRDIPVGTALLMEINRKGAISSRSVTTSAYPMDQALDLAQRRLGIQVADVDDDTRSTYGIRAPSGVLIVRLRRGSPLDRIGVNPGDVIRQMDEARIENLADFKSAMVKYRDKPSVVLLVQRNGHLYHLNVNMKDNG